MKGLITKVFSRATTFPLKQPLTKVYSEFQVYLLVTLVKVKYVPRSLKNRNL